LLHLFFLFLLLLFLRCIIISNDDIVNKYPRLLLQGGGQTIVFALSLRPG
jgi:hypothetical protein